MKFTKLMVLALVLALFVCAFVACGESEETETQAPDVTETEAPADTDAPETDPVETEAEHTHDLEVEEKAATCAERGYKKEVCKTCGEVVSETAYSKTAHTASGEATCDTDSKCTVCGEVIEAAKGHAWGEATTVAATCEAEGKVIKTCDNCGEENVTTIAKLAHDIPADKVTASTAATCTSEGSMTGVCSICNKEQTVVVPAAHVVENLGDLAALNIVDGKIQGKCTTCGAVVDVTADVRFALNFDEADVATELAKYGDDFNYLLVYNGDQSGTVKYPPVVTAYPDATDGHTSVLTTVHNSSPAITFKGSLLADADYYVISFNWRATKYGHTTNKIGAFGQAAKAFDGVAGEGDMVYAFKVDRSNGDLYDNSGKNKFGAAPAEQWYEVVIVVDNESGTAYTYMDGVCVATTKNAKWQVVEGGEYTWRFGGIYNVYHVPEFDNFEVSAIVISSGSGAAEGEEGGEENDDPYNDGSGCAHDVWIKVVPGTGSNYGYIVETCKICNKVVRTYMLIPECDHSVVTIVPTTDATCTDDGEGVLTCDLCGTEFGVQTIPATGHYVAFENATAYEAPTCVKPGSITGTCDYCATDVTVDIPVVDHVVTSLAGAQVVDGVVLGKCDVCGDFVDVDANNRLVLDFDKSIRVELEAQDPENVYGFANGTVWGANDQKESLVCDLALEGDRSVLRLSPGSGGKYGNHSVVVKFNGDLLGDASYYMVSFDLNYSNTGISSTGAPYQSLFGLAKLSSDTLPSGLFSVSTSNAALVANRLTSALGITNASQSVTKSVTAKTWYNVVIIVDNATGNSDIYIDGEFLGSNTNKKMLVENGEFYSWVFGGVYNNQHRPLFDNFKVAVLETACPHGNTSLVELVGSTCTVPGIASEVCDKCGAFVGTVDLPLIDHVPGTIIDDTSMACAYTAECAVCATEVLFEKVGCAHSIPVSSINKLDVVDGTVYGTCTVCGLYSSCLEDVRLALDFDEATVAEEVASLATAENALVWNDTKGNITTKVTEDGRTVMAMALTGEGRGEITFDKSLLSDAQVFVISFDWRATSLGANGVQGVFGSMDPTNSMWAVRVDRTTGQLSDVDSKTNYFVAENNTWYNVTIVVKNGGAQAAVYVDGVCYRLYYNDFYSVTDSKTVCGYKFAQAWNTHGPQFDNFKVSVIK